jgi:predicted permease
MVAGNFFAALGVVPHLGRLFVPEECGKGGRPAVLLSYAFWQRQFGGDPAIVGQAVTLSKQSVTVAGVLPSTFDFGAVFAPGTRIDVFVPAILDEMRSWGNTLAIVGRLKPDVSGAQAQAEADVLFPQLKEAHKEWWGDYTSSVVGLKESVSGKLRRALIVLWCAVGLILLIVCVNLSNLMLARSAARGKEFAMRVALGAGRGRLLRQLLTESIVFTAGGALLGVGLARALTAWLARQGSLAIPLLTGVTVDAASLWWTLAIAAAAALLFGSAPALNISVTNLQASVKDSGHGTTAGRRNERLRAALVVSEVALACVLLVGAGLLLRSFLKVLDVDLGFQPARAAVVKVDYDDGNNPEKRGAMLRTLIQAVKEIPGIEAAGIADMLPLGRNRSWGIAPKGEAGRKENYFAALVRIATPGYLDAMGVKLKGGRDFAWSDTSTSERVVILNETAARRFWPGEDAVGRAVLVLGGEARVIGVVSDVRQHSLETSAGLEMYLMATQAGPEGAELVVRTTLPPAVLAHSVMAKLRTLNPAQPAAEFRPLQHIVDRSVSPRRFFVLLVGSFAALGLILASLGIYGVISYSVTRQTQEIGIRMALGATAPRVQMAVLKRALTLASAGVVAGTIGSVAAAKWIESLLFGTTPTDPRTFAIIVAVLVTVALIAAYIPARRASRIDPMIALRTT